MKKNQEEKYLYDNIKDSIYPWVKQNLVDHVALNGKYISEKDTPLVSFVGDLMVAFAIKRGDDVFEIVKDNMLPDDCDIEQLYYKSCENVARDVEFVIGHTMFGGFAIMADGHHEASSLCLKHIWKVCAEKLEDDLIIMAPAKDMVLFIPYGWKEKILDQMVQFGSQSFERNNDRISKDLFLFSKEREELVRYEQ
jgi:hypothetical protein